MLIVDGAHCLEWTEAATNPEVSSGRVPCTKTEVFLLLTATLEELGTESYFARLRLSNTEPLPGLLSFMKQSLDWREVVILAERVDSGKALLETARAWRRSARASSLRRTPSNPLVG